MTTAARGSAAENVIETGRGCFSGGRIRRNGTLYCLVRQIWDQYPPPDARHAAKTDCRFIPNADPLQRREPRFPYLVVARMPRIDRSLGGKTKIDGVSEKADTFGDDGLKRFDAGLGLGVAFEFGNIVVGVETGTSFTKVASGVSAHNLSALATIGYKF